MIKKFFKKRKKWKKRKINDLEDYINENFKNINIETNNTFKYKQRAVIIDKFFLLEDGPYVMNFFNILKEIVNDSENFNNNAYLFRNGNFIDFKWGTNIIAEIKDLNYENIKKNANNKNNYYNENKTNEDYLNYFNTLNCGDLADFILEYIEMANNYLILMISNSSVFDNLEKMNAIDIINTNIMLYIGLTNYIVTISNNENKRKLYLKYNYGHLVEGIYMTNYIYDRNYEYTKFFFIKIKNLKCLNNHVFVVKIFVLILNMKKYF